MTRPYGQILDRARFLAWVRETVASGQRFPTQDAIDERWGHKGNRTLIEFAREGLLTIEVTGKNWRVVTIDGKSSMAHPNGWRAYRRIDKSGDQWMRDGAWERRAG